MKPQGDGVGELIDQGRREQEVLFVEGTKICHSKQGGSPMVAKGLELFDVFLRVCHKLNCDFLAGLLQEV